MEKVVPTEGGADAVGCEVFDDEATRSTNAWYASDPRCSIGNSQGVTSQLSGLLRQKSIRLRNNTLLLICNVGSRVWAMLVNVKREAMGRDRRAAVKQAGGCRIVQLDSQPVQTQISSIAAISRSAINTGDW